MVNSVRFSPTVLTTRCERISKDLRRSGPIGVFVITGPPRARSTHEDDRTTRPHCWCLQEEGRLIFKGILSLARHFVVVAVQRHLSFGPKDILSFTRSRLFPCLFSTHLLFQLILRFRGKLKSPSTII